MKHKSANWFLGEAVLSFALVLIMWFPIGEWELSDLGFVLERIIGGGDLLAVAFTLLAAQLVNHILETDKKIKASRCYPFVVWGNIALGAIAAVCYGAIKVYHARYTFPSAPGPVNPAIVSMTNFTLVYSIFVAVFIYIGIVYKNSVK